jgi:adenosylhomocysteinase
VAHNRGQLEDRVYGVPADVDAEIAKLKLETMGIEIDVPTEAQRAYLASWTSGT